MSSLTATAEQILNRPEFSKLNNRVVVEKIEKTGRTKGSILIADTYEKEVQEGMVVACDPDLKVKEGDNVMYFHANTTILNRENKTYLCMEAKEVIAITKRTVEYQKAGQFVENTNIERMSNDWIFVQPKIEDTIVGGVRLPDTSIREITQGKAVAVSPDGDENIKLNDILLFKRNCAFSKFDVDGVGEVLVLKKGQILGVLFGDDFDDVAPIRDKVFLQWEYGSKTYGNTQIVRPDSYKDNQNTGVITAIGPDVKKFKVGERVIFENLYLLEFFDESKNGNRYAFIRDQDIFCVIKDRKQEQR